MHQVMVTANRLSDGAVVYLTRDGEWTREIDAGHVVAKDEADALTTAAEEAVARQIVVAPYAIEVDLEAGRVEPVRIREQIRAKGPTVAFADAD